jgi:hypothetical protein
MHGRFWMSSQWISVVLFRVLGSFLLQFLVGSVGRCRSGRSSGLDGLDGTKVEVDSFR